MLTKALLDVDYRGDRIEPAYRDPDDPDVHGTAAAVIEAFEPGATRGAIEDACADLERHGNFKFVRGLATLLERRATFETRSPVPPHTLRSAAFDAGPVTSAAERDAALEAAAKATGIDADAVEAHLWADRESERVLDAPPDAEPTPLVREYNRALAATLLFDAVEVTVRVADGYRRLFRAISRLGLMYAVEPDLGVRVRGPAALVKRTRKYGTRLAKLLPAVTAASDWALDATIERRVSGEDRTYRFETDAGAVAGLFPQPDDDDPDGGTGDAVVGPDYDSTVERDFARRIDRLADGWTVVREPTVLRAGDRAMIPDFGFRRERDAATGEGSAADGDPLVPGSDRFDDGCALYLEVVGFWTPEYLESKMEKVETVAPDRPLLIAVDGSLACTESDFEGADGVIVYDDDVPVGPVLDRLSEHEREAVDRDRERLDDDGFEPPDEVESIDALAGDRGVEPDAVRERLADAPGVVTDGRYVPPDAVEAIRARLDALDDRSLEAATDVLDAHGLGEGALPDLGYRVEWNGLDRSEARVFGRDTGTND
jgi:predicted nuclease of restriction endonuclease-like RecB superfamily